MQLTGTYLCNIVFCSQTEDSSCAAYSRAPSLLGSEVHQKEPMSSSWYHSTRKVGSVVGMGVGNEGETSG